MPADHSKPPPPTTIKRIPRKVTEEEQKDIELKRLRGEISCAECRRLKLKCDKKVPCSSCARRGCESICPLGVLSAGQGTRFILADTEQLHQKIAQMSVRIRQLEDALEILHSSVSAEIHPLLSEDLLTIKFGSEIFNAPKLIEKDASAVKLEESVDALGTLTLNDYGDVKYFGRSGGSETLLLAGEEYETTPAVEEEEDEDSPLVQPPDSPDASRISFSSPLQEVLNLFPFTSAKHKPSPSALEAVLHHLPSYEQGVKFAESFVNHGSLFFRPMKSDELLTQFLPSLYQHLNAHITMQAASASSPTASPSSTTSTSTTTQLPAFDLHSLSTLFFILAIGSLLDVSLPAYNETAESFYDLGRCALSMKCVFSSPQLTTVMAVGLMGTYQSLAGKKYSRDSAWSTVSLAAKLAQSVGLHRDASRWKFEPHIVQKRRNLFWEIFSADISHSLALGRPPAVHLSYVDCEFPIDDESTINSHGEPEYGFWRLKHIFSKSLFMPVADMTLSAEPPSYQTILDLDKKARQMPFSDAFKPTLNPPSESRPNDGDTGTKDERSDIQTADDYHNSSKALMEFFAGQHRTVTMLYLHRSFFAQALLDNPTNPLKSPFAPSVLTAYRASSVIIKAATREYDRCPQLTTRIWFLLQHIFSAAMIVGSVVSRTPSSHMAPAALQELIMARDLMEKAAFHSQRAKVAGGVLRRLEGKALQSWNEYRAALSGPQRSQLPSFPPQPPHRIFPSGMIPPKNAFEDALAIFGGQARVLPRKPKRGVEASPSGGSSADSSPASVTSSRLSVSDASLPSVRGLGLSIPGVTASDLDNTPTPSMYQGTNNTSAPAAMDADPQFPTYADLEQEIPPALMEYYSTSFDYPTSVQVPFPTPVSLKNGESLAYLSGDKGTSISDMYTSMMMSLEDRARREGKTVERYTPYGSGDAALDEAGIRTFSFDAPASSSSSLAGAVTESTHIPQPEQQHLASYEYRWAQPYQSPPPFAHASTSQSIDNSSSSSPPPHPPLLNAPISQSLSVTSTGHHTQTNASALSPLATSSHYSFPPSAQPSSPYPFHIHSQANSTSHSPIHSQGPQPSTAAFYHMNSGQNTTSSTIYSPTSSSIRSQYSSTSRPSRLGSAIALPSDLRSQSHTLSSETDIDMQMEDISRPPPASSSAPYCQLHHSPASAQHHNLHDSNVRLPMPATMPNVSTGPTPGTAGDVIDMGISTGSGMDQNWLSFVGQSGMWESSATAGQNYTAAPNSPARRTGGNMRGIGRQERNGHRMGTSQAP